MFGVGKTPMNAAPLELQNALAMVLLGKYCPLTRTWPVVGSTLPFRNAGTVGHDVMFAAGWGCYRLWISGDLVLAADNARFTVAYISICLASDLSANYKLPRVIC